ncbi:hypothetical protein EVAR_29149_1 [Eumeta japonica]|uniref:Uncharacterized protein n=1 Tax=Eumeta variegata TaxID=151549 RepID=A0A4C1VBW7_EUMVA|nr:hypothetical protein EVAR_29149_1 [Eumeta japonica]
MDEMTIIIRSHVGKRGWASSHYLSKKGQQRTSFFHSKSIFFYRLHGTEVLLELWALCTPARRPHFARCLRSYLRSRAQTWEKDDHSGLAF